MIAENPQYRRIFLSDQEMNCIFNIIPAKIMSQVTLLLLLCSLFTLIAAMAKGGPVTMIIEPFQESNAGTCDGRVISLNQEYCANNGEECTLFMQNCLATGSDSVDHHCNAALVFLLFACKLHFMFQKYKCDKLVKYLIKISIRTLDE